MLGKLIKYDLRALLRQMWYLLPILAAAVLTTLVFSLLAGDHQAGLFAFMKGFSLALTIGVAIFGFVRVLILCFIRFNSSMIKDEGYLTHTLPVSETNTVLSKIISSYMCIVITFVAGAAALLAIFWEKGFLKNLWEQFEMLCTTVDISPAGTFALVLLYFAIGGLTTLLLVFAAISLGQLHNKGKTGMAVAYGIGFYFVHEIVNIIILVVSIIKDKTGEFWTAIFADTNPVSFTEIMNLTTAILCFMAIMCFVYTIIMVKVFGKHINLE